MRSVNTSKFIRFIFSPANISPVELSLRRTLLLLNTLLSFYLSVD